MASVLITAGPTREYLDEVRYLSNGSSGRMGIAVAEAARAAGHPVCLVTGPVPLDPPPGVEVVAVVSALEMHAAVLQRLADTDVVFGVAAVADYRPARREVGKPAKNAGGITLQLVENPDILADVGARKAERARPLVVVGFALESGPGSVERAQDKLRRKHLDLIALNQVAAVGADDNQVTLLWADGRKEVLPRMDKRQVAARLVESALHLWEQRQRMGSEGG